MQTSDEALFVLGSISQHPLTHHELLAYMHLDGDSSWTNLEYVRVTRVLHYLRIEHFIERALDSKGKRCGYQITETGQEVLAQWLQNPSIIERTPTFSFDLIVNAWGVLSLEERRQLINQRRAALISRREQYKSINNNLPANQVTHQAILQHHLACLRGELNWLDQLETDLSSFDTHEMSNK